MASCKNCGTTFDGVFCPNCGQKRIEHRYQLLESISWLFNSIFNFERGFLYTSKEMILHPGKVIKDFLNGVTVPYAHPFRFVFIWASISALIGVYFHVFEASGMDVNRMLGQNEEQLEISRKMMMKMKPYMSFIIMGMIPFMALGTYVVTKRKQLNYAEHLILLSFSNGLTIIVGIPIMMLYLLPGDTSWITGLSYIINIGITGIVLARAVDDHPIIGILKYLLSFLLGALIMMVSLFILTILIAEIYQIMGLQNPFQ